jgi:hypothetical protein
VTYTAESVKEALLWSNREERSDYVKMIDNAEGDLDSRSMSAEEYESAVDEIEELKEVVVELDYESSIIDTMESYENVKNPNYKRVLYRGILFEGMTEGVDYFLLDLDKDMQTQPDVMEKVNAQARKEGLKHVGFLDDRPKQFIVFPREKGWELYDRIVMAFGHSTGDVEGKKKASLFLDRAGIAGNRYPVGDVGRRPDPRYKNYVLFSDKYFKILEMKEYQKEKNNIKAGVKFTSEGKALIYASERADFSSYVHEMGHIYRRNFLEGEDLEEMEKWCGVENHFWTAAAEEKFAEGFEQYLREHRSPNRRVGYIFDRMSLWLQDIYDRFSKHRMPNEVKEVYDNVFITPAKAFEELDDSFATQKNIYYGNRDERIQRSRTEAMRLQDNIKMLLGKKKYDEECREMDQAIHIWIELQSLEKDELKEIYRQLSKDHRKIVDKAKKLPANMIAVAEEIQKLYDAIGEEALEAKIIHNMRENYVAHVWQLEGKSETDVLRKFGTTSRHAKQRVFATTLHGWMAGYEQRVSGATNNLQVLKEELIKTIENKKFIDNLRGIKDKEGRPMLSSYGGHEGYREIKNRNFRYWDFKMKIDAVGVTEMVRRLGKRYEESATESETTSGKMSAPLEKLEQVVIGALVQRGMTEDESRTALNRLRGGDQVVRESVVKTVTQFVNETEKIAKIEFADQVRGNLMLTRDGTLLEKAVLFAPADVAERLDKMFGVSTLKGHKLIDEYTRLNAQLKQLILFTSLYHHMAFLRSYYLGTTGKNFKEGNFISAYRTGNKLIKEDDPDIILGVRNGLTLGKMQEWDELALHEKTKIGAMVDKVPGAREIKDKIVNWKETQTRWLFETFGAGLKAMAFKVELRNALEHNKKLDPSEQLSNDEVAANVAGLMNADFGGLHLERMERSQTAQHLIRILFLAPDWTESNIQTMYKSFKKGEEGKLYRKFWLSVMLKGMSATVFLNFLTAGGDPEKFLEQYRAAWEAGEGSLLHIDIKRLTAVDITSLYDLFGWKRSDDTRKYFSILGHFVDPFKFAFQPVASAKHKSSVLMGVIHDITSGTDWAGRRFTTFAELMETGKTVTWGPGHPISYLEFPSFILNQLVGFTPIQIQNALGLIMGEMDAADAIMNSMGLGITQKKPKEKFYYE